MEEIKLSGLFTTLGTDINKKFAWALREVNGVKCVVLHKREDGYSGFNEDDFITAIPVDRILSCLKLG